MKRSIICIGLIVGLLIIHLSPASAVPNDEITITKTPEYAERLITICPDIDNCKKLYYYYDWKRDVDIWMLIGVSSTSVTALPHQD